MFLTASNSIGAIHSQCDAVIDESIKRINRIINTMVVDNFENNQKFVKHFCSVIQNNLYCENSLSGRIELIKSTKKFINQLLKSFSLNITDNDEVIFSTNKTCQNVLNETNNKILKIYTS